jgi:hypothetical protein
LGERPLWVAIGPWRERLLTARSGYSRGHLVRSEPQRPRDREAECVRRTPRRGRPSIWGNSSQFGKGSGKSVRTNVRPAALGGTPRGWGRAPPRFETPLRPPKVVPEFGARLPPGRPRRAGQIHPVRFLIRRLTPEQTSALAVSVEVRARTNERDSRFSSDKRAGSIPAFTVPRRSAKDR